MSPTPGGGARHARAKDDRARGRGGFAAVALCFVVGGVCASLPATAGEAALAETLYRDGRALMAAGRTAEACAKFEESLRLDAATGTLLNLAVCHEAQGKLATAWAEFRTADSRAANDGRQDRVRFAREHLALIEPRLSFLTIVVREADHVSELEIKLDGTVLGPAAWNGATPIDPGNHVLEARAPGYAPFSRTLTVGTTPARHSLVVALVRDVVPARQGPTAAQADAARLPARRLDTAPERQTGPGSEYAAAATFNSAAYGAVAVGVAAVAVGTTFGVRAFSRWSARNRECPMDACTPAGLGYAQEAETAALTANISVGVGVAALLVGGYLFYRAHTKSKSASGAAAPATGMGQASASLTPHGLALAWAW